MKGKDNIKIIQYGILATLVLFFINWSASGCTSSDKGDSGSTGKDDTTISTIPDKAGMTIKGKVVCDGKGIKGVEVSDGIEVTQTDADGIYYLNSKKKYSYVFISIPSGYEVPISNKNTPIFFKYLTSDPSTSEEKDFTLNKVDNSKHAIIAMADFHLCNRSGLNDQGQFDKVAADINSTIVSLQDQGYKVYGLSMGDESWDLYWYSNNFNITAAMNKMQEINCPLFHCLGNHDNDPYYADDWMSEQAFIKNFPAYYSFNVGDNHYIVLDDVKYINNGASIGTIGDRSFDATIIDEEMSWLKKDLSLITDKNQRIIVAMHVPLYDQPDVSKGQQTNEYRLDDYSDFISAFNGFTDVHLLTGHTHDNYNVDVLGNIQEHNTAGICATWWWTNNLTSNKQHICRDGSPGGYSVYLNDGPNMNWYYKGCNYDKAYQFRAYDLNQVYIEDMGSTPSVYNKYVHGYGTKSTDNKILINVWNYNKNWKVEAIENGKSLAVTRIATYDPLHILCYDMQRYYQGNTPTSDFVTIKTDHMFECTASSATSTVTIKVTDEFGNVYTENMSRPKAFSMNMK
nr:calcineurin-like phosphoesterase family protein [Prevotella sp. UBA4952]